jgi:hypothetical protein
VAAVSGVLSIKVVEAEHTLRNVRDEWIQRIDDLDQQLRETRRMARERIIEAERLVERARAERARESA